MKTKFLLPEIPPKKFKIMVDLVAEIERASNSKKDTTKLIEKFNNLAESPIEDPYLFTHYHGSMSREDFVAKTFIPHITKDPNITDEDLLVLIKDIFNAKYPDERYLIYWLEILKINLPGGEKISDLIFWENLSPEEVLKKAKTPFLSVNICKFCGKTIEGTYMFNKHIQQCNNKNPNK